MAFFNLRSSTALLATVLLIMLSSPSQAANIPLERRQDQCNPTNNSLNAHDCAVAFYQLNFQGENKVLRGPGAVVSASGTCRVVVDCPGGVEVSAGRLLDKDGTNGFDQLQKLCTVSSQMLCLGTARIVSEESYPNLQKLRILNSGKLGTLVLVVVADRSPGSSPRNRTDFWKLWILDCGELGTIIFFILVIVVVANIDRSDPLQGIIPTSGNFGSPPEN
ncbi:hypothetical protein PGTUg99_000056 [Puccinia graminis f. sp. tritici]|uniref:Uncharacterized protein n=1 Tax=Puccinia graminis f. sp. tritici TaxID=56615 RepID=A0A5B0S8Y5_PUCGR|nr:hypothetical protein PGTUg99_000056 [Puccinia graminis f. sp. tritici]